MEQAEKVQRQFNQQAERFATWEVTCSEVNLQQFSRFCKLQIDDRVLEAARGTGSMVNYCAFAEGGHTVVMSRAAFNHFADPLRAIDEIDPLLLP